MSELNQPFKAGGALGSWHRAYTPRIYEGLPVDVRAQCFGRDPQVIASPSLAGKTTELQYIIEQQKRANVGRETDVIECRIPELLERVDEDRLRFLLCDSLRVNTQPATFRTMLIDSRRRRVGRALVLAIISTENLHIEALRWLLRSTVDWNEQGIEDVKVLIDGSFSLETMTSGPNSEFPMAQVLVPPEFDRRTQELFVKSRLDELGIEMTSCAARQLWSATGGEKYLTQALGSCLLSVCPEGKRVVSGEDVDRCIRAYVEAPAREDLLRSRLLYYGRSLMMHLRKYDLRVSEFLEDVARYWPSLDEVSCDLAYRGGIVRKVGERTAELRAPILRTVLTEAEARAESARSIFSYRFSLDGILDRERENAVSTVRDVESASFDGTLKSLHVGFGTRKKEDLVNVEGSALGRGEYNGEIRVSVSSDIRIGENLWFVHWGHEPLPGERRTVLRTFAMKKVPADVPLDQDDEEA